MYCTNVFIYKKLLTVKNELISMAEDFTDCKIKYSSIRPYVNSIIIQQVYLINKENHNVIQLGTVKIDYSIFSWLKNNNSPLNLLTGINIKNLHLDFSIEKLKEIKLSQVTSGDSSKKLPDISNILFSFSKSSLRVQLEDDKEAELSIDSLRVNFFHNKANVKGNVFFKIAKNTKTLASTQLSCTGEMLFSPNFQIIFPEVTFSETQLIDVTLRNQSFRFKYELPMTFSFERLKDQYPIELNIYGNTENIQLGLLVNKISLLDITTGNNSDSSENILRLFKPIKNMELLANADFDIKNKSITANASGNMEYKSIPLLGDANFGFDVSMNNSKLTINDFDALLEWYYDSKEFNCS